MDKIILKDYDLESNAHFIQFVFIPYFKDIYNDLASKSDKSSKGISKIVFSEVKNSNNNLIQYAGLPGILGERLFKVFDENNDDFID